MIMNMPLPVFGTNLTAAGVALNGSQIHLPAPTRMEIVRSLDSPAANISVSFPMEIRPADLLSVRISSGLNILFDGRVDEQSFSLSSAGGILTVEARDRAAGLLDNEAKPQTLWGANLTTMFSRLVRPYGFELRSSFPSRTLPEFTITRGMSEWDAFAAFVTLLHGARTHVEGRHVAIGRPSPGAPIVFSNSRQNAVSYSSLIHRRIPYRMISRIFLRDAEGMYSSFVRNPAAAAHGVSRTRYIIPPGEFEDNSALSANQRITRAQYQSDETVLRCPGLYFALPGRAASVEDSAFSQQNQMVDTVRHLVSSAGISTEFTLRSWVYY